MLFPETVATHTEAVADSTVEVDMTGYKNLMLLVEYTGSPNTGGYARAYCRSSSGGANIAHPSVTNEKTSNQTVNYATLYLNCPPYMAVALDWTDGKITVTCVKFS
jgi:hypothetical protein